MHEKTTWKRWENRNAKAQWGQKLTKTKNGVVPIGSQPPLSEMGLNSLHKRPEVCVSTKPVLPQHGLYPESTKGQD